MKKYLISVAAVSVMLFVGIASFASAHVVVKPGEAKVGAFTDFSVGVPVERDVPTVGLRLVIPEGLEFVTPLVKQGWKIDIKRGPVENKTADDGDMVTEGPVTEISWTGGEIPAGFKDQFVFSAKVPAKAGTVQWKAYQTYKDGSIVSWDLGKDQQSKDEKGNPDFSKSGPYSETKIVDDLATLGTDENKPTSTSSQRWPFILSIAALAISVYALIRK